MAGGKSRQIKIYVTIGLTLVLIVSAYFRVIRPRIKTKADAPAPASPAAAIDMPKDKFETLWKNEEPEKKQSATESISSKIRDIFAGPVIIEPDRKEKKEEKIKEERKPILPSITLKGTITGGENPIAIINGKFLRVGDWVGDYQLVHIYKNEVLMSAGKYEFVVEVLKNVHN